MDWVSERVQRETKIINNAGSFWAAFRLACEQAVRSYQESYRMPFTVSFQHVDTNAFTVFSSEGEGNGANYRFGFNPRSCTITYNGRDIQLELADDGTLVANYNGKKLSAVDLSREILEPLMFREGISITKLSKPLT